MSLPLTMYWWKEVIWLWGRQGKDSATVDMERTRMLVKRILIATVREDMGCAWKLLHRKVAWHSELPGCPRFTCPLLPILYQIVSFMLVSRAYSSCPSMVHRLDAQMGFVRQVNLFFEGWIGDRVNWSLGRWVTVLVLLNFKERKTLSLELFLPFYWEKFCHF